MRVIELGGFEIVACALKVALRDYMDAPRVLCAFEFAFGGGDLNLGEIAVLAALQYLTPDLDRLAGEGGVGARQACPFPLIFIGERRAFDLSENIAGFH